MKGLLISAIVMDDHIRVEVHEACIVEYSDNQQNWCALRCGQFEREGGVPVFRDYEAPLNHLRSYRALTGSTEIVTATLVKRED